MYGSEYYTPETIASIAAKSYYDAMYGANRFRVYNSEYLAPSSSSSSFPILSLIKILPHFYWLLEELSRKDLVSLKSALRMFTKRQIKNWENLLGVQFDTGFLKFKRNLNKELQHRDDLHKDACRATTAHQAIVAANVAVIPPTTISSCSFI
jgi:hypothetical protein